MSERDLTRVSVLSRMMGGDLTLVEGAELLALRVRQAKRLKKHYVTEGARGLRARRITREKRRSTPFDCVSAALEVFFVRLTSGMKPGSEPHQASHFREGYCAIQAQNGTAWVTAVHCCCCRHTTHDLHLSNRGLVFPACQSGRVTGNTENISRFLAPGSRRFAVLRSL